MYAIVRSQRTPDRRDTSVEVETLPSTLPEMGGCRCLMLHRYEYALDSYGLNNHNLI
jgi:hypothetical protein